MTKHVFSCAISLSPSAVYRSVYKVGFRGSLWSSLYLGPALAAPTSTIEFHLRDSSLLYTLRVKMCMLLHIICMACNICSGEGGWSRNKDHMKIIVNLNIPFSFHCAFNNLRNVILLRLGWAGRTKLRVEFQVASSSVEFLS